MSRTFSGPDDPGPRPEARSSHGGPDRLLTIPNVLSGIRLALVPVFVTLFLTGHENVAVIIFAVGAFSDLVDGYIARRTDSVTAFGQLLDPLADRIFIGALAVALLGTGVLYPWLAAAVIARDVAVVATAVVLQVKGLGRPPVHLIGKLATAALFFGLTCLALSKTSISSGSLERDLGTSFVVAGAVLYYIGGIIYGRDAARRLGSGHRVAS